MVREFFPRAGKNAAYLGVFAVTLSSTEKRKASFDIADAYRERLMSQRGWSPFVSPTGERSHLPVRSALGKRHWRLTPPPSPPRGVNFYLAASFANAKLGRVSCTKCNLTRSYPPRAHYSLAYHSRKSCQVFLPASFCTAGPDEPDALSFMEGQIAAT